MRPSLSILEPELIERIVDEAKRVLAEVGMEIRGPEMRRRLLEHGLPLDATGDRVLFPRDVVEAAIASAPSSFLLYDRDGEPHADLGGDRVHFVPGSSGLKVLDHRTGETRLANSTDFVEYVRLADGLANIPYLATAFSTNDDIEAGVSDAWRLYMTLTNSKKPVVSGAFTEHGVPRMVEMMQLFRRDRADLIARPMSIFTITATGNFRYSEDSCQNLIDCVEAGVAVEIVPVTLMGLIAPVTVVGATVFHTADVLAGITMAQIVRPGAPVLFGGAPATFHMKIASSPMSAIEALQLDAAYVAVAKSLGLPTQSYMALSDGPILDAQAGAETFGSALIAALAGVNSVSGPGDARLPARVQPAEARLRRRDVRPGIALRPRGDAPRRPAGRRARRPPPRRPAPDHGRAHDRPLADRAVPAERDRRSRQPRGVAAGRWQGHLPACLRRGRSPTGRLQPGRDRPGHRRRAAPDHPLRVERPEPCHCRRSLSPRSPSPRPAGSGNAVTTAAEKPPRGQPTRRIPRHDHAARHAGHRGLVDPLLRAVVPTLAVLREDPGGRLQRLRHLQPHVPARLLRGPDRGVLGAAQRRHRVGRVGRADRRDHRAGRVGVHEHAHLSRPDQVRGRTGQVHDRHGRGRRDRQRPRPAADRGEPLVDGPRRLRCRPVGARRGHPRRDGRQGPRARGLSGPGPGPEVEGRRCGRSSGRPSTTSSTTGR